MTKKEIRHCVVCNLSYNITSALIETKLYSKVITNMVESLYRDQSLAFDLERIIRRQNCSKMLREFLLIAFDWNNSSEGYAYWKNIGDQYRGYAIQF